MFNQGPIFAFPFLYLDPGSGSFIIQLILGVGLGIAVGAKVYWNKLKSMVTGRKDASIPVTGQEDPTIPPTHDIDES